MPEKEVYERTIEHLCGEVDALREMLLTVASMLPERALYAVSHEAGRLRAEVDREAAAKPNDLRKDYSAGFWDIAAEFEEVMDMCRDELEAGERVRIIQPARIPEDEQHFPQKGW